MGRRLGRDSGVGVMVIPGKTRTEVIHAGRKVATAGEMTTRAIDDEETSGTMPKIGIEIGTTIAAHDEGHIQGRGRDQDRLIEVVGETTRGTVTKEQVDDDHESVHWIMVMVVTAMRSEDESTEGGCNTLYDWCVFLT